MPNNSIDIAIRQFADDLAANDATVLIKDRLFSDVASVYCDGRSEEYPEDILIWSLKSPALSQATRTAIIESLNSILEDLVGSIIKGTLTDVEQRCVSRICRIANLAAPSELRESFRKLFAVTTVSLDLIEDVRFDVAAAYEGVTDRTPGDLDLWNLASRFPDLRALATRVIGEVWAPEVLGVPSTNVRTKFYAEYVYGGPIAKYAGPIITDAFDIDPPALEGLRHAHRLGMSDTPYAASVRTKGRGRMNPPPEPVNPLAIRVSGIPHGLYYQVLAKVHGVGREFNVRVNEHPSRKKAI